MYTPSQVPRALDRPLDDIEEMDVDQASLDEKCDFEDADKQPHDGGMR